MNAKAKKARNSVHWIQGAIDPKNKGALHRQMGIPEDDKIPVSKLRRAAKDGNTKLAKRARLALTLRKLN